MKLRKLHGLQLKQSPVSFGVFWSRHWRTPSPGESSQPLGRGLQWVMLWSAPLWSELESWAPHTHSITALLKGIPIQRDNKGNAHCNKTHKFFQRAIKLILRIFVEEINYFRVMFLDSKQCLMLKKTAVLQHLTYQTFIQMYFNLCRTTVIFVWWSMVSKCFVIFGCKLN